MIKRPYHVGDVLLSLKARPGWRGYNCFGRVEVGDLLQVTRCRNGRVAARVLNKGDVIFTSQARGLRVNTMLLMKANDAA